MSRIRLYTEETRPGALPLVCLVCGRPALAHVARTFIWRPKWISILTVVIAFLVCFPLGVALVVASAIRTKRATIECPLCDRHRHYWWWRGFWISVPLWVLSATVITLAILMLTERIPGELFGFLFLITSLLLLAWAVTAAILQWHSIRCLEIVEDSIVLEPVSPEFAALVRSARQRYHQPQPQHEPAEVYDPYPR